VDKPILLVEVIVEKEVPHATYGALVVLSTRGAVLIVKG
jgi:hypothetical protein